MASLKGKKQKQADRQKIGILVGVFFSLSVDVVALNK